MKIKIIADGSLFINGATKLCPFVGVGVEFENTPRDVRCGNWCALFTTEIVPAYDYFQTDAVSPGDQVGHTVTVPEAVEVTLCRRQYSCSIKDFTDERPKS